MADYRHFDALPDEFPRRGGRLGALALVLLTWGAYFVWVVPRLWLQDGTGLFAGYRTVAEHWPGHSAIASLFAYRPPEAWFLGNAQAVEAPFVDGFVVDAAAGLLLRAGLDHGLALMLTTLAAALLFLAALMFFCRNALDSTPRAWLAATLFLAAGGIGASEHVQHVIAPLLADEPSWRAFAARLIDVPVREYAYRPEAGQLIGNPLLALLIGQRDLLIGMAWALALLSVMLRWYLDGFEFVYFGKTALLGIGLGLLPAFHGGSLVACAVVLLFMLAGNPRAWGHWLTIALVAATVALPLIWFLHGDLGRPFWSLALHVGGLAKPDPSFAMPWHEFWWQNRGLFLPLAAVALLVNRWWGHPVALAGLALFALVNLVQLRPLLADNAVLLAWSQLLLAVPVAHFLGEMRRVVPFGVIPAFLLVVALTASAALDQWRLAATWSYLQRVWGPWELQIAEQFRLETAPTDRVLTTGGPTDWVAPLTGRPVLLGDPALLIRDGIAASAYVERTRTLLKGGGDTAERLSRLGVGQVTLDGNAEHFDAGGAAWFREHYPETFRLGRYRGYRIGASGPSSMQAVGEAVEAAR